MGARGPLRLVRPDEEAKKESRGTVASKINGEPVMPPGVKKNPKLRIVWESLVPELVRWRIVGPMDALAIDLAIRHYVSSQDASDDVMREGHTLWDEKNERHMLNPSERALRSQSKMFLEYAKSLGMTFASRARLSDPDEDQDENPFSGS